MRLQNDLRQFLVASLLTGVALPASAACEMHNRAEIPVTADQGQLLTQGLIDDQSARVLIDTGADVSLVWRPAIERLGLRLINAPGRGKKLYGVGGESEQASAFVDEFRVAAIDVTRHRFPVAGDRDGGLDFILAEDLLSRTSLEFDLRHHAVRTMELTGCTVSQLPYWSATYSMADLIASPQDALAIRIAVKVNGRNVSAQFDSGSSVSILSKSLADSLRLHSVDANEPLVGIGRKSLPTWIADVQSFSVGDETINNTQLRVAEMGRYRTTTRVGSRIPTEVDGAPEMLLGLDFLRAHRVLVDNTLRKMVFTYEGGPVFEVRGLPPSTEPAAVPAQP
jgi:predicted aspartyl protease